MDTLPLILLDIQTALKEDISSTAAEMVYGTTLRLPDEFFTASPTSSPDPSDFVSQLKSHFQTVQPIAPRQTQRSSHISDCLCTVADVLSVMIVFASLYSHPTMDPFQSFHKQTFNRFDTWSQRYRFNRSSQTRSSRFLFFHSCTFSHHHFKSFTFASRKHPSNYNPPPPLLAQLVLVVECIFSHVMCKTLGGSDVVNTSIT